MIFSGERAATSSISMPPASDAMTTWVARARSRVIERYSSRSTAEASSTSTDRTWMPSGGVCGVLSLMPRICRAAGSAASGSSTSLMPPALPRPPACTCALTTTRPPSRAAIVFASAGVAATSPLGTGTPNSRRRALAWYSWICIRTSAVGARRCAALDLPQHPQGGQGPEHRGPVAQHRDRRSEAAQPEVLQDEPEAMGPVVERERDQREQVELDQRVPGERQHPRVADRGPPQRNGQAMDEQMDGHEESGHHPARREQQPPEWFDGFSHRHSSASEQEPEQDDRHDRPEGEARSDDQLRRHLTLPQAHDLDDARQIEPGHAVIERERERHDVEDDPSRSPEGFQIGGVGPRSLGKPVELDQEDHQEERNEHARQLAQHEPEIVGVPEPPGGGQLRVVESRALDARHRHRRPPRGMIIDRSQSVAPASFERWMAAAGSTPFGQTTEHSPTKVHSQTPTASESTGSRRR